MSIIDDSLNELISACNTVKENIAVAYSVCQNKGATIPSEKNIKNLSDAIDSILGITPTETINITENISNMDITNGKLLNVNISNLTQHTSGSITLSSDIAASQTSYDTSKLKITVGFEPKIFLFRPYSYDTSRILGAYSTSYNIMLTSTSFFDDIIVGEDRGYSFSTFITKLTASSSYLSTDVTISGGAAAISVENSRFYLNPNNLTEVWWYCSSSSYLFRAGEWFWEAYA